MGRYQVHCKAQCMQCKIRTDVMFQQNDPREMAKMMLDLVKGQNCVQQVVELLDLMDVVIVGPRRSSVINKVPQRPEKRQPCPKQEMDCREPQYHQVASQSPQSLNSTECQGNAGSSPAWGDG